jgi:hypothetical protein
MKSFVQLLKILVFGMVVSCAVNSLLMELNIMPKMAASTMGTNIGGSAPALYGVKRKDFMYGDFNIGDKGTPRPTGYATRIGDTDSENNQLEFPSSW